MHRNLVIHNSMPKTVQVSEVDLRFLSHEFEGLSECLQLSTNPTSPVESGKAALIGSVAFDTSKLCRDVLSSDEDGDYAPVCYAGFSLDSAKGKSNFNFSCVRICFGATFGRCKLL